MWRSDARGAQVLLGILMHDDIDALIGCAPRRTLSLSLPPAHKGFHQHMEHHANRHIYSMH
jgi:hypothetical protein